MKQVKSSRISKEKFAFRNIVFFHIFGSQNELNKWLFFLLIIPPTLWYFDISDAIGC